MPAKGQEPMRSRNDRIVLYYTQYGFSAYAIADWYGLTHHSVYGVLHRRGLSAKDRGHAAQRGARIASVREAA